MDIGNKIRELRKGKHLSMKALGEIIGVSEQAISQYERNKRNAPLDMLEKIAFALNVNLLDILGDHGVGKDGSILDEILTIDADLIDKLILCMIKNHELSGSTLYKEDYDLVIEALKNTLKLNVIALTDKNIKLASLGYFGQE